MKLSVVLLFLIVGHTHCAPYASTLKYISVLFRHGDRAPDQDSLYPNDPYINETFLPMGYGGLTNQGKSRMYGIGSNLRKKYNAYLGDIHLPGNTFALTTDTERTKMCLQLVMAGLWPPTGEQIWNDNLSWMPLNYQYFNDGEDSYMGYPYSCKRFQREYANVRLLPEIQCYEEAHKNLYNQLTEHMGRNINTSYDLYLTYFGLQTESEIGLDLPAWTKDFFPEHFIDGVLFEYKVITYTKNLLKITAGAVIKKILEHSSEKIQNPQISRKISLFSSHEYNVATLLIGLGANVEPHIPYYGAYVAIEVHEINSIVGLRVFYGRSGNDDPEELLIANCEQPFCPLDEFMTFVQDILPNDNELCYQKN